MSFNFSDNEEEDFDLDAYDDTGLLALASRDKTVSNNNDMKPAAAAAVATPSPMSTTTCAKSRVGAQDMDEESFGEEEEDGGDWDNVNWKMQKKMMVLKNMMICRKTFLLRVL